MLKFKFIFLITFLFSILFGGDIPFGYRSIGIDRYSSGEIVKDGECYALVWVKSCYDFKGYFCNGKLIDEKNNIQIYVRSLAKNGKCPPVNFIVPESFVKDHSDGIFMVLVLDTRCSNGTLAKLSESNTLMRVNMWGYAKLKSTSLQISTSTANSSNGSIITELSKIPESCRKPIITKLSFDSNGNALIECINTENYLSYCIEFGSELNKIGEKQSIDNQDGNEIPIIIIINKDELNDRNSAFFRVKSMNSF